MNKSRNKNKSKTAGFSRHLGTIIIILVLLIAGYYSLNRNKATASNISRRNDARSETVSGFTEPQSWQQVGPRNKTEAMVFSAYARNKSIIVVSIYSNKRSTSEQLYCQLWPNYPSLTPCDRWKPAKFSAIPEQLVRRFAIAILTCEMGDEIFPDVISIVAEPCKKPLNFLKVIDSSTFPETHLDTLIASSKSNTSRIAGASQNLRVEKAKLYFEANRKRIVNFTMCVMPMIVGYNNVHQLVEMIEVNRIFGAERFIFYNYSMGKNVERYLQSYINDGIAELIQWDLPSYIVRAIIYFGQVAALNDCVYRASSSTRFILNTDLDEFIVPRRHSNWYDMLIAVTTDWVKKKSKNSAEKSPGAFMVLNTFFRNGLMKTFENDSVIVDLRLRTQLIAARESYVSPYHTRTKYIMWPRMVRKCGIHLVWDYIDEAEIGPLIVSPDDALMQHYRLKKVGRGRPLITDNRMHVFRQELISKASLRHNIIKTQIPISS